MMNLVMIARLYDSGFRGFPLARNSKAPERGITISSATYKREDTIRFAAECRLAWHLSKSRLLVVDWDVNKDKGVDDLFEKKLYSNSTNSVVTPSGGAHLYYRITDWRNLLRFSNTHIPGLDIKHFGDSYVKCYNYPDTFRAQEISVQGIRDMLKDSFCIDLKLRPPAAPIATLITDAPTVAALLDIINRIDPDIPYTEWGSVACAIKSLLGHELGSEVFDVWSSHGETYRGQSNAFATFNSARPFRGDAEKFLQNLARRSTMLRLEE